MWVFGNCPPGFNSIVIASPAIARPIRIPDIIRSFNNIISSLNHKYTIILPDSQTFRPSDSPTLRLSDPPTLRPSDPQTLRPIIKTPLSSLCSVGISGSILLVKLPLCCSHLVNNPGLENDSKHGSQDMGCLVSPRASVVPKEPDIECRKIG